MFRPVCSILLVALLAGCDGAPATSYDSSNPVNCLAIFGLANVGARAKGDQQLSREMQERQTALVKAQGGINWLNKIAPEAKQFATQLERDKDGGATETLLRQCKERHPR